MATSGEVTHIATVQTSGWIDVPEDAEEVVASHGFTGEYMAISWATEMVRSAHGEEPTVTLTSLMTSREMEDGTTKTWAMRAWTVRTSGGPTWAIVVEC